MTIVVQFESKNWYAEGVAVMANALYEHPLMIETLERIAKQNGFDFVSEFERETCYSYYHQLADEGN
ncbi:hypothetical protein [Rhodopirellula europaea]|uniref:hypothetical protein n=1 Tax=Rhodopirellula europaea TaxID=1263866 RepID=UPI003D2E6F3F|tara:strand:- start:5731 stop:5931 length:201 start_codon:yes stop_codon:yes gene_type:complete